MPAFAIATGILDNRASRAAQDPRQWFVECIKKNNYSTEGRRESLAKYGISIFIPGDMDFNVGYGKDGDDITISQIEGLAERKCNDIAVRIYGRSLSGRGLPSITISLEKRLPGDQDKFVDSISIQGRKWPIYTDTLGDWLCFASHSSVNICVSSYDLNLDSLLAFVKEIRFLPNRLQ